MLAGMTRTSPTRPLRSRTMAHRITVTAIAALLLGAATSLRAQTTLTFNDLECELETPLESYRGFSFVNTSCANGILDAEIGSGYFHAGGGTNVIFGDFGDPFDMFGPAPFNLTQFRVAPAWRENLVLTVEGISGGRTLREQFILTGPASPQTIMLNWMNISRIRFTTEGGDESTLPFDGPQAAVDDIVIGATNSAIVPEPSSGVLVASGMLLVGLVARRQKRRRMRHIA